MSCLFDCSDLANCLAIVVDGRPARTLMRSKLSAALDGSTVANLLKSATCD